MAQKSVSLLMILAILAFSSLFGVSTAFGGRKALAPAPSHDDTEVDADSTGLAPLPADLGFTVLDNKDPKVVKLATSATDEYNKANNAKLVFSKVLEATTTTDAQETLYGLVILATDAKGMDFYNVKISVVNDVPKVTSFSKSD